MRAYTLATYHVLQGRENDFLAAWNDLAELFASLESPPYWGTLIRSRSDRLLFHSFGPWPGRDAIADMRSDPRVRSAFERLGSHCSVITAGDYEVIRRVAVHDEPSA